MTAACYWLVLWLLLGNADTVSPPLAYRLPDLGNGMGPMMKTLLIGNLIAGTTGGWVTLALSTGDGSRKPFRCL